jgi:hypothetical protein
MSDDDRPRKPVTRHGSKRELNQTEDEGRGGSSGLVENKNVISSATCTALGDPDYWRAVYNQKACLVDAEMERVDTEIRALQIRKKDLKRLNKQQAPTPGASNHEYKFLRPIEIAKIQKVYKDDARTSHELDILIEIHENPVDAREISDKRLRYLARASAIGWKAAEEEPDILEIGQCSQLQREAFQRRQMEMIPPPPLPPAFRQNKNLLQTRPQVPLKDRAGKPIRNPTAYLAAIAKNATSH